MNHAAQSRQVSLATEPQDSLVEGGSKLIAAGGIVAAIAASSCCVLPFALFTLGISGAWIGNLTALAPYQPIFVAAALAFLGVGFWRVYCRPREACIEGSYCARPASNQAAKIGLWTAAVLVTLAVAFPYIARFILEA